MNVDTGTFQTIHDTYRPKLLRYLRRLVGESEAEDLVQEIFVRIDKALVNFRGESSLSTWIYRIATNAALDRLKSRSARMDAAGNSVDDGECGTEDRDAWTGEKKPSPETALIRKEMNDCIRDIIDELPTSYRSALALSEMEGFTNQEISEILGVSLDTVKIRLHRARARLKQELEKHCRFYRDERNELACDRKIPTLKFIK
jgi:RNA polymerase sigma-70 factor (ECF subfamily)